MKTKRSNNKESSGAVIQVVEIQTGIARFCILGTTPLVMNTVAEKAAQQLLLPSKRKNEAEREISLKHDPVSEFCSAIYQTSDPSSPTRAYMPARAFSRAIADVTRDTPGATRTEILRLVSTPEINVPIYGLPSLYMTPLRQSDINRTLDIRTRAIFPQWACIIDLEYIRPKLTQRSVTTLVYNAGKIIGIGDDRRQKGGYYGRFELVNSDHPDFVRLVEKGGREAQDEAIANPACYDESSENLLSWFQTEVVRREKKAAEKKVAAASRNSTKPHNRTQEAIL